VRLQSRDIQQLLGKLSKFLIDAEKCFGPPPGETVLQNSDPTAKGVLYPVVCEDQLWTTVQWLFRTRFGIDPPPRKTIYSWCRQFEDAGYICKGKSTGRSRISEENVDRIQETFQRSPRKSTYRGSRELQLPQTTVWRFLQKRLSMKCYKLQLLQGLKPDDKVKRY
jgi:hypothetical protein